MIHVVTLALPECKCKHIDCWKADIPGMTCMTLEVQTHLAMAFLSQSNLCLDSCMFVVEWTMHVILTLCVARERTIDERLASDESDLARSRLCRAKMLGTASCSCFRQMPRIPTQ